MGQSNEKVYLPNGSTLTTKHKTLLPFNQLTKTAREALVLPGLKKSLASVSKWADEGYTTIFHPGEEGVTIHDKDSLTITMKTPPLLHGIKTNGDKLWTIASNDDKSTREETHNVYSLPSMTQSIKYLHAAAGFPVKETWLTAIEAGNYVTWPGLTTAAVRKHFPDSD